MGVTPALPISYGLQIQRTVCSTRLLLVGEPTFPHDVRCFIRALKRYVLYRVCTFNLCYGRISWFLRPQLYALQTGLNALRGDCQESNLDLCFCYTPKSLLYTARTLAIWPVSALLIELQPPLNALFAG